MERAIEHASRPSAFNFLFGASVVAGYFFAMLHFV